MSRYADGPDPCDCRAFAGSAMVGPEPVLDIPGVRRPPTRTDVPQRAPNLVSRAARAAGLDPDEVALIRPQLPGQGSLLDLLDGDAS